MSANIIKQLLMLALAINVVSVGGRILQENTMLFQYHKGPLLTGKISMNLVWYGNFKPSQKAIISDFITSLSSSPQSQVIQPSVTTWVNSINQYYYNSINSKNSVQFSLGSQILDEQYSLGKSLKMQQIKQLASKGTSDHQNNQFNNIINVVLTSSGVAVEGFCSSRCGTHELNYIWIGNSETQCPGQCAWPFHQPVYGPQGPPLVAPNNDVGLDGMVMNLATLLAGTVTNPFGNGYYQGPASAPLEAASACTGIYGKGAYPGFAGNLMLDTASGASYNSNGVDGRKYLLPALFDPISNSCSTLV
ncbi:hypothetical protein ACH5RR_034609 [Cinchona calisaya]|uniref:Uncharacterized protein n=1 Tax=Cinchona calisaya TaxID=153742 RepID=A0ABD2YGU8_9GENT